MSSPAFYYAFPTNGSGCSLLLWYTTIMDASPSRTFIELPTFTSQWTALGFTDEQLSDLQQAILVNPQGYPVVPGSAGFRKVRVAVAGKGKRGGARVLYADIRGVGVVILGVVFMKNRQSNLSAALRGNLVEQYRTLLLNLGVVHED